MAERRTVLAGRREQVATLSADGLDPVLSVVRGEIGSGRSAVLEHMAQWFESEGATVLRVGGERRDDDRYGIDALLRAIYEQFEQLDVDTSFVTALSGMRRTQQDMTASAGTRTPLLAEAAHLLARLGARRRVVVVVDDADAVVRPEPLLEAARAARHRVLCAVATQGNGDLVHHAASEVVAHADQVVDLPPLTMDEIDDLVTSIIRVRPDPALRTALRRDLGPWSGNPAAVLDAVRALGDAGDLVTVGRQLCLRDPDRVVRLPPEFPATVGAAGPGARELVAVAAAPAGLTLDELDALALLLGHTPDECGRAADALVVSRVLRFEAGVLALTAPALGATVCELVGERETRRLHAALAATPGLHEGNRDSERLADRLVAAGDEAADGPSAVPLLREHAARVRSARPDLAAQRLRAAWYLGGGGADDLAGEVISVLVEIGDHAELATFVRRIVQRTARRGPAGIGSAAPWPTRCADLARTAALAALATGHPVPPDVDAALRDADDAEDPLALCARWFAGGDVSLGELRRAFAPWGHPWSHAPAAGSSGHRAWGLGAYDPASALACRDPLPALASVLGPIGALPRAGAAVTVHELLRDYGRGDWDAALAGARSVVGAGSGDSRGRRIAMLFGAEISSARGEKTAARAWLDDLGDPGDLGDSSDLRAWVECGLLARAGEPVEALRRSRRACSAPATVPVLRWRLLLRTALIAVDARAPEHDRWVLDAARSLRTGTGDRAGAEFGLLVTALLSGDPNAAQQGVAAIGPDGVRSDLFDASLVAGLVSPEPDAWLQQADALARGLGATARARVRRAMEERRVTTTSASRARTGELGGLGVVERKIIELVGQNRTNRQIAGALQMSEKSVEKHLTRLFLRVGCRNRYGLAAASLTSRVDNAGTGAADCRLLRSTSAERQ